MLAAEANNYFFQRPKRAVAIRRDGDDFVVSLMPNDLVIFRNESAARATEALQGATLGGRERYCNSLV